MEKQRTANTGFGTLKKKTTLQRLTFTLVLLISELTSFSQDKHIVLQIDTLILNGYDNFSISITGQGFGNFEDFLDESTYIRNTGGYPNFICPLTLKTDSSNIQISLDNQGGYLQLMDVYNSKFDTLKINKVVVYDNCYRDTTYTRIEYYLKIEEGTIDQPFKTKNYKSVSKKGKCKNRPPFKKAYTINDELYLVSFQKKEVPGTEISTFDGYEPKKYLKDPDNYKGKVRYFHGQSSRSEYINVITLRIKSGT